MPSAETYPKIEIASQAALWAWLAEHHGQAGGVWLVTWKAHLPDKYLDREAVLDALVAHGWIDGVRRKVDADRTMQLISPRQQQAWAASYKDRAARLEAEGRMHPHGRAEIDRSKAAGLWDFFNDVDALIVPDDLEAAFSPAARAWYDDTGASYRRNLLRWLKLAKTAATRQKRITAIAAACAAQERIPQM